MDLTLITSLGILVGCLLSLSWFAGSDAPFIPTKMLIIKEILKSAGVKKGKKFYELGSGDGRVVIEAAKLGAYAVGIEQSLVRVFYSKYITWKNHLKNTRFIHGNVFQRNYTNADVIFIYLLPKGVAKLEPKLKGELKKGSVIITQTFHFKKWRPFKKINLENVGRKSRWDITGAGNFQLYRP